MHLFNKSRQDVNPRPCYRMGYASLSASMNSAQSDNSGAPDQCGGIKYPVGLSRISRSAAVGAKNLRVLPPYAIRQICPGFAAICQGRCDSPA